MTFFTISVKAGHVKLLPHCNLQFNRSLIRYVMRIGITTVMILVTAIQLISAPFAKSQNIEEVEVKLELKDESLLKAFKKIESQSPFYFMYRNEDIGEIKNLNISETKKTVAEFLELLLTKTDLTYQQIDNRILIKPQEKTKANTGNNIINGLLRGVVKDNEGNPLPGVTVKLQGPVSRSASTNVEGNYTFGNLPSGTYEIAFSYIGFATLTKQITLKDGQEALLDVSLSEDVNTLNEVVVVGYGTQRRSDLTGSVSSVTPEDFEQQPVNRIDEALQGRAAGVQITRNSGAPGGDVKIRIRGANSLRGNNDPLYVIDGFIGGDFQSLNPNDIESIEVLKDASATAVYGSRGANGVVLVTTKTGKSETPQISFKTFYSISQVPQKIELLNSVDFAGVVNEMNAALGANPAFSESEIAQFRTSGGTDWQDQIFQNGAAQNYQLSLSGGGKGVRYFVSGNIQDQDGIMKNIDYSRYSLRTNLNADVTDKLKVALNLSNNVDRHHNSRYLGGYISPLTQALGWAPTEPVYETDGTYNSFANVGSIYNNPVAELFEVADDASVTNLLLNGNVRYAFTKELSLTVLGGYQSKNTSGNVFNGQFSDIGLTTKAPTATASDERISSWQNSNILTYEKEFNTNHRLTLTGIYEQQVKNLKGFTAAANGLITPSLTYYNLGLGTGQPFSNAWKESLQSFVGRANYSLFDKYLFTATLRADGSSKFYNKNKYGYFPSAAFAWRMTEEPFIKNLNTFYDLKLRASYGATGSQAINAYAALPLLRTGQQYNYALNGAVLKPGVGLGNPGNEDLKWETTTQTNLGADMSFFNGRLAFTFDLYHKNTTDLLLPNPVPRYAGGGNIIQNLGSMQNRGVELSLSGDPFSSKSFKWNTSFNFTLNRTKVTDLGGLEEYFPGTRYGAGEAIASGFVVREGEPLGQFYGFDYLGVWKSSEAAEAAKFGVKPGDSRYRDLNGDNSINTNDLTVIGNAYPDFVLGLNNSFQYKNFSLNLFLQGRSGGNVFNMNRWYILGMGAAARHPTSPEIMNRWTPSNENTDIPAVSTTNRNLMQSSRWLEDGSFIRVKNVNLSYSLPKNIIPLKSMTELRMYVSAQNLFTFTSYKGYDPEASQTESDLDTDFGIDSGSYPNPRLFTFGLDVTF